MDLVNEKHIAGVEVGEDGGQVAGPVDRGAGGDAHVLAHLRRDDAGERCLAQTRRAVEQHVIQRVVTLQGCLDVNAQAVLDGSLAHIIPQASRAQRCLYLAVLAVYAGGQNAVAIHAHPFIMPRRASRTSSLGDSLWPRTWLMARAASAGVYPNA